MIFTAAVFQSSPVFLSKKIYGPKIESAYQRRKGVAIPYCQVVVITCPIIDYLVNFFLVYIYLT